MNQKNLASSFFSIDIIQTILALLIACILDNGFFMNIIAPWIFIWFVMTLTDCITRVRLRRNHYQQQCGTFSNLLVTACYLPATVTLSNVLDTACYLLLLEKLKVLPFQQERELTNWHVLILLPGSFFFKIIFFKFKASYRN